MDDSAVRPSTSRPRPAERIVRSAGILSMHWQLSHRAEKAALAIADRHYNRQKPGSPQFVPPGRCLVLTSRVGVALWVTSWPFAKYVKHAWGGAWVNSCFRRESGPIASELIWDAVAATIWFWKEAPRVVCPYCDYEISMVTFIDTGKTKKKRDPGRCYVHAGFKRCKGKTKGGLVVVHIRPEDMPVAQPPYGTQERIA